MGATNDGRSETSKEVRPGPPGAVTTEVKPGAVATGAPAEAAAHPDQPAATPPTPPAAHPPASSRRKWLVRAGIVLGLVVLGYFLVPWVITALNTVSTDDAYVNGHVTFVAPRVLGQVTKVLVDDNYRVKKGDILVQLDKEPYEVQLNIKKAAVVAAERDLAAAQAQAHALVAQARGNRFKLEHAIEDVNTQIANLGALVATLKSKKATLELSRSNLKRGEELAVTGGISKEELDQRRQTVKVDEAAVEQALQTVYASRANLGLTVEPPKGHELAEVPSDLDQTFSSVRQALANTLQSAAQLGYFPHSWDSTPKKVIANFYNQDAEGALPVFGATTVGLLGSPLGQGPVLAASALFPGRHVPGTLDRIYNRLVRDAPAVKQGEAKLLQAQADLAQAELNLRYCDILSEIDGQVTRRNVNPGNNVQVGQSLMAVRSLTEIWIDCNFKETQLANLRIGQRVRCEVDMYGSRREFEGRITGFTMGTGETLSLLPPQNATGNFVKIVQRLPVRIELTDYHPDTNPLFVGLSCVPYVYYKEPPEGPHAGEFLQPFAPLPKGPTTPK